MKTITILRLTAMALILNMVAACTQKASPSVPVKPGKKNGVQGDSRNDNGNGATGDATVRTQFSKADFAKYSLDYDNLSFRFSFLNVTKEDKLDFSSGTADVSIPGLPANQEGEMTLIILENNKERFRATKTLTLKNGSNSVELVLRPGDASAEIRIKIDDTNTNNNGNSGNNGNNGNNNNGNNGNNGSNNNGNSGNNGNNNNDNNNGSNNDASFSWDGKSNKGNKNWMIEVVK